MRLISRLFLFAILQLYGMGTQFVLLPSTAEELSVGTHSTLSGLFPTNPALYSSLEAHPSLSFNRGAWLGDVTLSRLGYNQSLKNKTFHFGVKYAGISGLEYRDHIPQDNALSEFSSFGLALDAGISVRREYHKFGFSLSYLHMGLYTEHSRGIGMSLGYLYDLRRGFKVGTALKNIGLMTKLVSESPSLPMLLSIGLSKELKFNEYRNTVYGSMEVGQANSTYKYYLGNQFTWNRLSILGGFALSERVTESSIGVGISLNRYKVTYGIKAGSQNLGLPQIVSLMMLIP